MIATSSCTGAMHMGLTGLGIKKEDEIIMADTNWIAVAAPIVHIGAKPVFVDILEDTWCIDPDKVEKSINDKTKAIIAVHLYGNLCDMTKLQIISEKYSVPISEDAAEAIGSIYKGKRAGSMSKFGTFSLHGTKTITSGEGGLFVTNDKDLYENVLTLSNHGKSRFEKKQFWPSMIGFKYKMSNVQAAIACAQLERIDELVERKIEILEYYKRMFNNYDVKFNVEKKDTKIGAWMPNIVLNSENHLFKINNEMKLNKIDARPFFWPLSDTPPFNQKLNDNFFSYDIAKRALNLPSYHDMTKEDLNRVINVIKKIIKINE